MDQQVLFRTILDVAYFLDESSDEAIDPDAAVQQLEFISAQLQSLSPAGKQALVLFCRSEAARFNADPALRSKAAFFESFAQDFGLGDPG